MNFQENCRDTTGRRRLIRARANEAGTNEPNGIDYVEVEENQRVITVFFLNKAPRNIEARNVRITGGVRVRDLRVTGVTLCEIEDPDSDDCMKVTVDRPGDFSTYTLRLSGAGDSPLEGFDPRYSRIDFSFKANCPGDLDCAPQDACDKETPPEPDIDYLAKDYASFRQLIFNRLSLVMPDWRESHVPDLGVTLVELFAYVGDYLSYYQDAVATEAYLDTARLRISVRRHARLVDYPMHDGCNARVWVCVNTSGDVTLDDPKGFYFVTDPGSTLPASGRSLTSDDLRSFEPNAYEVFEPLLAQPLNRPVSFYAAHNRIRFYTWHDAQCCLPRGATSATLEDEWKDKHVETPPDYEEESEVTGKKGGYAPDEHGVARRGGEGEDEAESGAAGMSLQVAKEAQAGWHSYPQSREHRRPPAPRERKLRLKAGDVLVFEEVRGAKTGDEADADSSHRHAVRLTLVEPGIDPLDGRPIIYVEWGREDALPFPLCISSVGEPPGCAYIEDVSVARGNVVLADHGRTVGPEDLPAAPPAKSQQTGCEGAFAPRETIARAGRFRPTLNQAPITNSAPFPAPPGIARAQAISLGGLMGDVRRRVERLWQQARHGHALSREDLNGLEIIFGQKTLARVELSTTAGARDRNRQNTQEQANALGRLVARFDEFLMKKSRRVESLRGRALGGYVLGKDEREELGQMFGAPVAVWLELADALTLGPAAAALPQQPREAVPSVSLCRAPDDDDLPARFRRSGDRAACWEARGSLLESGAGQLHFVAEMDDEGRAHLRFGDGENGRAPVPGETLRATYRVGNGGAGNVGAEAIKHVIFRGKHEGVSLTARNPLPARGGIEPETIADVKARAPGAIRKDLQRAVIAEDYARLAERGRPDKVQRAAAGLNWAGSWHEMRTTIDPRATGEADHALLGEIESMLHRYRRIGHDLSTSGALYVPLDIALEVCVLPHYLRGHVKAELLDVFSNRALAGGRRGLFHPDNMSFGESIFLSRLVAVAQGVEGVESVRVTRLQRLFEASKGEIEKGVLAIRPLEVARLDNDPNYPEHGQLMLDVRGGR
jgi:predicted phage baseplate assembly protein